MRRLQILLFWLTRSQNNVTFKMLLNFLLKPTVDKIARKYIREIREEDDCYVISFHGLNAPLYWPRQFAPAGIYQVTSETFDQEDWHYYQRPETTVEAGEVLLDVGTAEGLFPLTVVDKCKKIILVEPNPLFVSTLRKTFAPYRDKVELIHAAVGNQEGELFMEGGSLSGKMATQGQGESVPVKPLDVLLKDQPRITYLKADVEGYELPMLQGAAALIQRHKPKIAVTTYHNENDPAAIIAFVKGLVPEYKHFVKGIAQYGGKPVMIHFWI
jgi:FkbM family methyltransferase